MSSADKTVIDGREVEGASGMGKPSSQVATGSALRCTYQRCAGQGKEELHNTSQGHYKNYSSVNNSLTMIKSKEPPSFCQYPLQSGAARRSQGFENKNLGSSPAGGPRYFSYLLPKQAGGSPQILVFKTLRMTSRPALYIFYNIFKT